MRTSLFHYYTLHILFVRIFFIQFIYSISFLITFDKISFPSLTKPSNSKHTCPYALGLFVVNLSSDILPARINCSHNSSALISSQLINSKIAFVRAIKVRESQLPPPFLVCFLLQINLRMKFDSYFFSFLTIDLYNMN